MKVKTFFMRVQDTYIDDASENEVNEFLEKVEVSTIFVTAHNDVDLIYVFYEAKNQSK